jgi:hypothetical protein
VQVAQRQPITGTPKLVPVPRKRSFTVRPGFGAEVPSTEYLVPNKTKRTYWALGT